MRHILKGLLISTGINDNSKCYLLNPYYMSDTVICASAMTFNVNYLTLCGGSITFALNEIQRCYFLSSKLKQNLI